MLGERGHGLREEIVETAAFRPAEQTSPGRSPLGREAVLLGLQQSAGNAAVGRLLASRPGPSAQLMPSTRRHPLPVAHRVPTAPVSVARQVDESAQEDQRQPEPESADSSTPAGGESAASGEGSAGGSSDAADGGASGSAGGGEAGVDAAGAGEGQSGAEGGAAAGEAGAEGESAGAGGEESAAEGSGGEAGAEGESAGAGGEESAAEGSGAEAGAEGEAAAGEEGAEAGADGDQEHSAEEQAEKQAEGETGSELDEHVAAEGGAYPIATSEAAPAARFVDGGRAGTIPFTEAQLAGFDPQHDREPHAFAAGGRTGTKAWAGGGGAGPKGNQPAGSIQNQVEPDYDSDWGGLFSNASAWVKDGTGVVDVTRNYVTSDAGDQGNGWWVSDKAAGALEAHEQRHIANSRDQYATSVQPVLDRIANSRSLGANKTYKSADARALLKHQIGWKAGLESFVEADQSYNAPNMIVDTNDTSSGALPRPQHGPRKIAGKDYDNYLIMNSEPDPT